MRHFLLGSLIALLTVTPSFAQPSNIKIGNGGSPLAATLMQRYAQDPAFLVCATVLISSKGHQDSEILITEIKMIKNAVTFSYIADSSSAEDGACYFDKNRGGAFTFSYGEYLKALKAVSIDMPMSAGELNRLVTQYEAIANGLPNYPIDPSATMLSDATP